MGTERTEKRVYAVGKDFLQISDTRYGDFRFFTKITFDTLESTVNKNRLYQTDSSNLW